VLPVLEALAKHTKVTLSVDTRRASVARAALDCGASVVNAVAGLRDPDLAGVCAERGALLILNHMRGEPRSMQRAPHYDDVVREVARDLREEAAAAEGAGVARERIWLDPGIGFGKDPLRHNLPLLARLGELVELGYPVLVGPSRKAFIGRITGAGPGARLPGTLAAVTACVLAGAHAVRVHDVAEARQAVDVAAAIRAAGPAGAGKPLP
jgi:dihydropteroate synthase